MISRVLFLTCECFAPETRPPPRRCCCDCIAASMMRVPRALVCASYVVVRACVRACRVVCLYVGMYVRLLFQAPAGMTAGHMYAYSSSSPHLAMTCNESPPQVLCVFFLIIPHPPTQTATARKTSDLQPQTTS